MSWGVTVKNNWTLFEINSLQVKSVSSHPSTLLVAQAQVFNSNSPPKLKREVHGWDSIFQAEQEEKKVELKAKERRGLLEMRYLHPWLIETVHYSDFENKASTRMSQVDNGIHWKCGQGHI